MVNYILSVTVVFDADKEANKAAQFTLFVILSLIGLGINQLMMWAGTSWLAGLMEQNAKLASLLPVRVYDRQDLCHSGGDGLQLHYP